MKKSIIFIVCLALFILETRCNFDPSYKDEIEAISWEDELAPLNEKEKHFIDSLSKIGINARIERNFIGRREPGTQSYNLTLNSRFFFVSEINHDSLENYRNDLANFVYSNIIADSVINDIRYIDITFEEIKYQKGFNRDRFRFSKIFFKDSLER